MRLCMKHWNHLKAKTPEGTWLTGNLLVMQKVLDKLGRDIYTMQQELGDGCPVCFMEGDELLEGVIQEINALRHTCDKVGPHEEKAPG